MTEEKKKEKKKEEKETIEEMLSSIDFEKISAIAASALKAQEELSRYFAEAAFPKLKGLEECLKGVSTTFVEMDSINELIKQIAIINVPTMTELTELYKQIDEMNKSLYKSLELVKMPEIPLPDLITELETIPPRNDTLVRSLLREIELLEYNLSEKAKELAAKDAEIKELRARLEGKKKRLEQYIA